VVLAIGGNALATGHLLAQRTDATLRGPGGCATVTDVG
jgi:hypothetical protein